MAGTGAGTGADTGDEEALARLERALDRIGAGLERPDPVADEVSSRLDAMIARVRAGLEG